MLTLLIGIYLFFTLLVGYISSKYVSNSVDFALAGRKMPTIVVATGLFATWFGSETVLGASSEFLDKGILGIIEDPFGAALCLFLIGLIYARPLYKLNLYTFSDYFRIRYDKKIEYISALFMIPSYFSWIAAQLIALAVIMQSISGLPFFLGVILCAFVVLFYTFLGGMLSISITDTIQSVIIILGLGYIAIDLYIESGGYKMISSHTPKNFFRIIPLKNDINSWIGYFAAWITIGLGSIPQQDVFQRVLSAKSEKVAVRGSYISSILYLSIAFLPLIIAICGSILYPDILKGDRQMAIPILILNHTNLFIQTLFFGALLSAILSTCSAAVLAPATVLAENFIKPLYKNEISDKSLLLLMRYSTVFIMIIAVAMSFYKSNIYELVGEASALSLVALFVPLTAGLFWKKSNAFGAFLSMLLGTVSWLYCLFIDTEINPMMYGFLVSTIAMVIGSFVNIKKLIH